ELVVQRVFHAAEYPPREIVRRLVLQSDDEGCGLPILVVEPKRVCGHAAVRTTAQQKEAILEQLALMGDRPKRRSRVGVLRGGVRTLPATAGFIESVPIVVTPDNAGAHGVRYGDRLVAM